MHLPYPRRLTIGQGLLVIAFVIAAVATVAFGTRAVVSTIYWAQHREEPIEPWMTIGYVAHSHRVPPADLAAAIGLPPDVRDRRPLAEIAASRGVAASDLIATLEAAIRAKRGGTGTGKAGAGPP